MLDAQMFYVAAILIIFPAVVIYAGASDMITMKIPNRLTLGLVGAFAVLAVWSGMPLALIGNHVAASVIMLLVGMFFFSRGWMGGGDAKLCAATALWIGMDLLLDYALLASVLGGLLTIGLLHFRERPITPLILRNDWLAKLHYHETGIPYGMALSAAGLTLYTQSFWFSGALG